MRILSEVAHEYAYTATATADGQVRVDWTTPNFERAFGLRAGIQGPAEMWKSHVPVEDHAALAEWIELLPSGLAGPLEHRIVNQRGDTYWVHHFARTTPLGDSLRIDGAAIDITERKLAERALVQSEARFRAITDHVSDLLVELNPHGRVVYVNPAVRELLGYDPDLLIGGAVWDLPELERLVHRDDLPGVVKTLQSRIESIAQQPGRCRLRHLDGGWRWFEFVGRSYLTEAGAQRLLVGRDVTEQRRSEEASREHAERLESEVRRRTEDLERAYAQLRALHLRFAAAEKLGAAEELAGSLAHAVNNPLAALLGRLEMELEAHQPSREGLQRIHGLAKRIRSVVSHTLTLFREGRLRLEREDPRQLLEEVRSELAPRSRSRGVEVRLRTEPDLPKLLVDRTLLVSALVSLAENGLDASPPGDVLELEAVHLCELAAVQVRIVDHGPGIPEAVRERIFEPFFTTKSDGTGLGLAIANGVVRGHSGRIEVHTGRDGTRFYANLPYEPGLDAGGDAKPGPG